MYLTDFIYDGYKLSDFGCIVGCSVTDVNENPTMGSNVKLETVNNNGSHTNEIINANYDEPIVMTFDIIKYSCPKSANAEEYFSDNELSFFMRWLNRQRYYKFIPLYDSNDYYNLYFMGTFTEIKAIKIGKHVLGLTLTFTTNASFGFLSLPDNIFKIPSGGSFVFTNFSDEIGNIYPTSFVLTCDVSGDYIIQHKLQTETNWSRITEIKNCEAGEVINMDCIHKVITTSNTNHTTLHNDFNYVFPRLSNTLQDCENVFLVNQDCSIQISYNPIRKAGVIV